MSTAISQATLVQDVMIRDVISLVEDSPLSLASKLMGDHHIRHLVVVDSIQRPVGVFSERDFLKYIARRIGKGQQVHCRMPVKELMVIQPRCVGPETSV